MNTRKDEARNSRVNVESLQRYFNFPNVTRTKY